MKSQKETIWLDLLCWESFIKIFFHPNTRGITIYYCQISSVFSSFLRWLAPILSVQFVQIKDISLADRSIDGQSVYQRVQDSLSDFLSRISKAWISTNDVEDSITKKSLNKKKLSMYLQQEMAPYAYRPIELKYIAALQGKARNVFFLKRTVLSEQLPSVFKDDKLVYYRCWFSHLCKIKNREEHYFDRVFSRKYHQGLWGLLTCFIMKFCFVLLKVIAGIFSKKYQVKKSSKPLAAIGVEQLQESIRFDRNNDFFWFENSSIKADQIYHLESSQVDKKSVENLERTGFERVFIPSFSQLFSFFRQPDKSESIPAYLLPSSKIFSQSIASFTAFCFLFFRKSNGLIHFLILKYVFFSRYWENLYSQLNMKILFSMVDGGGETPIKAQAIENIGGCFVGSHWSNYPLNIVLTQKCYDLMVAWGPTFNRADATGRNFNQKVLYAGYPLDHCYPLLGKEAGQIRHRYPDKFIISVFDNIWANDIIYSRSMIIRFYKSLVEILKQHKSVVLLIKPKKKDTWEKTCAMIPVLNEYINNGRVSVFLQSAQKAKVPASLIGQASDLSIGLGISTATTECFLGGRTAFYLDLTNIDGNQFKEVGHNKIVFTDLTIFQKRVGDIIKRRNDEMERLYDCVDPFQDGRAYIRFGFIIRTLQTLMEKQIPTKDALDIVEQKYQFFLKENFSFVGSC